MLGKNQLPKRNKTISLMTTYKQYFNPEPKKPWENPLFWIALLLTGIGIVAMVSCGPSSKNKSSFDRKIDSSGVTKTDQNKSVQNDNASKKTNESKQEEKKEVEEKGGVKAVFGKHDPKDVTGPVKIESDSSGGYSIDPGGRPLESLFLPKKKKTTETKKTETKQSDSSGVSTKTNEHKSDSSGASVKKDESGKSVVKNREAFNWYGLIFPFAIIAGIIFLLWVGKKYLKKLKGNGQTDNK